MLTQILRYLQEGEPWTIDALAQKLDTTKEMVTVMLEDLARRGYLKPLTSACSGACSACPMSGQCAAGSPQQIWTLTQKR